MDIVTAAVSIAAAVLLWKLLPMVASLPSSTQLRESNAELQKVGAKLQAREQQLRNLGDSLPDSFLYQYTLEGDKHKFLYLSSGVERLNGVKVDIVMQDAMMLLGQIDPTQRQAYLDTQAESLRYMTDISMELHMLTSSGEWRWMQVKSHPRKLDDGQILWDGIATDMTNRHLLETEINRLGQAIEQSPTGIIITDIHDNLEFMNASCTRICGYHFAEAYTLKRSQRELISSELTDAEYGAIQTQLQENKPWSGVLLDRHKNGKLYWARITVSPVYSNQGTVENYLYLRTDVTEQINAEAALKIRSAELERANADLTRFADVSAHHLMEPSRRLTSYAQQLRSRFAALPEVSHDTELRASLDYIEHDASRLRTMVRDVQLYLAAGMPRGEVGLEDPNEIVKAIQQRLAAQLSAQRVVLDVGVLPGAILDRPRFTDLFTLLLDNALRHGQSVNANVASTIHIVGERAGDVSRYSIIDNGCGIPAEYLERVFEIFERLSVTRGEGGTGIGLSIARRIVESRHGKIWIENLPEGGTKVVFELPDSV
jgi:PAS domain S-box-containing protein